jgi:hypothetical protein
VVALEDVGEELVLLVARLEEGRLETVVVHVQTAQRGETAVYSRHHPVSTEEYLWKFD